jgi:hypothetical protein
VRQAAVLALVLVVVAGCGKTTAKQQTVSTTGPPACPPFTEAMAPKSGTAKPPTQTMLLTDVKTAAETCADRVAFTFRPGPKQLGYRVEYRPATEAKTEDGSGKHLDIAGKAFLVVRFEPAATADLSGEKLEVTYKGPRTITPTGMKYVRQVTKIGDFEGVLAWTIGLSQERPFKVSSSGSPAQLTIEIG